MSVCCFVFVASVFVLAASPWLQMRVLLNCRVWRGPPRADMLPIFKLWSVVRCEPPRADTILVLVDQLNYFMFRYLMFPSSLAKVCGASGSC